ncbi:MAG TPA: TraR/DksA family transcriptional regulator [Myxococcota bacterium]|nr:TraR/DksA family transcriptional regulator [Myxococcota bacterium]
MNAEAARALLLTRLNTVATRKGRLAEHLHQQDGRLEADPEDRASLVGMDEVVEEIDDAASAEITLIRAALDRIDAGTWGTCVACGEPIPAGRLEALPEAATCVACAG